MQSRKAARWERARQITRAEANAAQEDLMQLGLELFSFHAFAERVWELRHTVTSDDACTSLSRKRSDCRSPLSMCGSRKPMGRDFLTPPGRHPL